MQLEFAKRIDLCLKRAVQLYIRGHSSKMVQHYGLKKFKDRFSDCTNMTTANIAVSNVLK